jgi:hypothetical protein
MGVMPRMGPTPLAVLLACLSTPVWAAPQAAPADDYERVEARQLGEEGLLLYDRGDYANALVKLEKASAFVEAPTLKLYQARCLDKLGRLVEAEQRYLATTAMPLPPKPSDIFLRAQEDARIERAALLKRIPSLEIRLQSTDTAGANVRIDGKLVDASLPGAQHPVDPGTRRVQVRVGDRVREAMVEVREGEHRTVNLDFSLPQSAQPKQAREEPGLQPLGIVGVVAMGVGAAGLLVWGGTGIAAMVRAGDLQCDDASCPAAQEDVDELTRLRTASTVSFWVGAPLFAVGTALLLISLSIDSSEEARARSFRIGLGPGFVGLEGRWE